MRRRALPRLLALAALGAAPVACAPSAGQSGGPLTVFATTGHLADVARALLPDAEVITMVGPGGDPHTYQPSTRDIERIQRAEAVLWNGLSLEAPLEDLFATLDERHLAAAEQLSPDLLRVWPATAQDEVPQHDPHVWNSPAAWDQVIVLVAEHLAGLLPGRAPQIAERAEAYRERCADAAEEARLLLRDVPAPRILVTGHDAFGYLEEAVDLEVHATDAIASEAALSPTRLSALADLVAEHRIPVIFQDNQVSPQAITSLHEAVAARGWTVRISDQELYADSLGAEPGVDTHLGVLRHNARTIADALTPESP